MYKKQKRFLVLAALMVFAMTTKVNSQDLSSYRWKNRMLVVQTTLNTNQDYVAQLAHFFKDQAGFKERRLVLLEVVNDNMRRVLFRDTIINSDWEKLDSNLKKILGQPKAFEVILIGLDGGVKLRQQKVLTLPALYEKIDTMPMRSRELVNKGNNK